jgi:integrase
VLSLLVQLLRTAHAWGLRGPVAAAKYLKAPPAEVHPYEPEEERRLVAAAKALGPHVYAAVLLGDDAGLRASEIAALERASVDQEAGAIEVENNFSDGEPATPKTAKSRRRVPLTKRLKEALRVQLLAHAGPRVFARKDGTAQGRQDIARWLAQAERRAGLRVRGQGKVAAVHRLRHTFGTRLAAAGATVKEIAEALGHASLKESETYIHLARAHRSRAIALLEESGE